MSTDRGTDSSAKATDPERPLALSSASPWTLVPERPAPARLQRGDRVHGKYVVERQLSEGDDTDVFLAWQEPLERAVVLKVLRDARVHDALARARFASELAAMGSLDHEKIAKVYEAGELESGQKVAVIEHAAGVSLAEGPSRRDPVEAVEIAVQVLDALRATHEAGMAYVGLVPGNVMVGTALAGTTIKLIDFGSAQPLGGARRRGDRSGTIVRSSRYAAPENEASVRADLYSVGVLLHGMLTGQPPTEEALATPPSELVGAVTLRLDGAVMALLAPSPDDRPFDATHAIGMLRAAIRVTGMGMRAVEPAVRAPRPQLVFVSSDRMDPRLARALESAGIDTTVQRTLPSQAALASSGSGAAPTLVLDAARAPCDTEGALRLLGARAVGAVIEITRRDTTLGREPRVRRFPLPLAAVDIEEIVALARGHARA